MSEIKPWPLFGYAPGGYLIQCIKCNTNHHTGDKRAIICGDCAAVEAKSRIASLEKENAELLGRLRAILAKNGEME